MQATLFERFEAKVEVEPMTGCWLWTGAVGSNGYGNIGLGARGAGTAKAHRVAYELFVGPVPRGLCVLHRCDTPLCVNPRDLWLGTKAENTADMVAKGRHGARRLTVCQRGHEFTEANTYIDGRGDRSCRACRRLTSHRAAA